MRLAGKVALISGGARGMGAVEARLFAREGARVVLGDILEAEGRQVATAIGAAGGQAAFVGLDVTSETDWASAVAHAVDRYGKLDVLVNNAGIGGPGRVEDTTLDAWNRVMAVNAAGVFLGHPGRHPGHAGGRRRVDRQHLIAARPGGRRDHQRAVSGIEGRGTPADEGHRHPVRRGRHPRQFGPPRAGRHPHDRGPARDPDQYRLMVSRIPLGRYGEPEEVAYGVLYLASDESSFVTGSELVIDGGWTAQ